jgi:CRISPR-associated protein Csb1
MRVVHNEDGGYLTSSRTEAHRLASAFIKDGSVNGVDGRLFMRQRLRLRDDRPIPARDIAQAVFSLDPFCLIHGVFFAEPAKVWPGQPKIARALTSFVEAVDVRRADSGGVKRDHVRHSLEEGGGGTAEGYGTIPFHRTEWTAGRIVASFALDTGQIASYGLPEPAAALLEAIALWEIRALLDAGLRFRTACDLTPLEGEVTDRDGEPLPTVPELEKKIRASIEGSSDLLGDGQPIEVRWREGKAKKDKK